MFEPRTDPLKHLLQQFPCIALLRISKGMAANYRIKRRKEKTVSDARSTATSPAAPHPVLDLYQESYSYDGFERVSAVAHSIDAQSYTTNYQDIEVGQRSRKVAFTLITTAMGARGS